MTNCLVFDLGAGSGRAMLATFDGEKLGLSEIYRFAGVEIRLEDGPHWDFERLFQEILTGIRLTLEKCGRLDSIGVDSWGVDYALVDENGEIETQPYHYRHPRSQQGFDHFPIDGRTMFRRTGAQILPVNTVYQLYAAREAISLRAQAGQKALMTADAVSFYLTGRMTAEVTLARTSGLLELADEWDEGLCEQAGIPRAILPTIIQPGQVRGWLRDDLAAELGTDPIPVIAVAGHDTASAVCGLPMRTDDAFLVCGSWLILGKEVEAPVISYEALDAGFGNEGGVERRPIFLRSLNGLHLLQKLQRSWRQHHGEEIGFAEMSAMAAEALRAGSRVEISPSDPDFFDPPDMVSAVTRNLRGAAPGETADLGRLTLAIYRGLVQEIADAIKHMEQLADSPIRRINICGGGGKDATLCRLIAAETGLPVRAGPIEASAWGNAILQLVGLNRIDSLQEGRDLVEKSNDLLNYYPDGTTSEG